MITLYHSIRGWACLLVFMLMQSFITIYVFLFSIMYTKDSILFFCTNFSFPVSWWYFYIKYFFLFVWERKSKLPQTPCVAKGVLEFLILLLQPPISGITDVSSCLVFEISLHCSPGCFQLLNSSGPPASVSLVAGTIGAYHHTWLCFYINAIIERLNSCDVFLLKSVLPCPLTITSFDLFQYTEFSSIYYCRN